MLTCFCTRNQTIRKLINPTTMSMRRRIRRIWGAIQAVGWLSELRPHTTKILKTIWVIETSKSKFLPFRLESRVKIIWVSKTRKKVVKSWWWKTLWTSRKLRVPNSRCSMCRAKCQTKEAASLVLQSIWRGKLLTRTPSPQWCSIWVPLKNRQAVRSTRSQQTTVQAETPMQCSDSRGLRKERRPQIDSSVDRLGKIQRLHLRRP